LSIFLVFYPGMGKEIYLLPKEIKEDKKVTNEVFLDIKGISVIRA